MSHDLLLPLRWARRELRAGIRGWRIFLLCLIVGIGTITLVQITASGITGSLHANGRTLLGGDLAIRATTPLAEPVKVWLAQHGGRRMESIELRSMARDAQSGENAQLVEIKAVEEGYPFYGEATVTDMAGKPIARPVSALLARRLCMRLFARWPSAACSNASTRRSAMCFPSATASCSWWAFSRMSRTASVRPASASARG